MDDGGLYEKVLERLGEGAALPGLRPPRASAAVIPWRRRASGIEVYWQQRSASLAFMGGWHAFPGGGLSRRDSAIKVAGRPRGLDGRLEDHALPPSMLDGIDELEPTLVPGLLACALRELFEETGVLPLSRAGLGGDGDGVTLRSRLDAARRRLLSREQRFGEMLEAEELALDASELVFAGRWITPPLGPMRFDNRFFLLEWSDRQTLQPSVLGGEADGGEWIAPGEALERWRRGEVLAAPPILHILEVLADDGPVEGLERLCRPEEANLGPFRRIELRPGVQLFPLATPTLPPASFTNAFVLGTREAVLVDPGSPFPREIDRLREGLDALRRRLGIDIRAIWLTHHHPDHVGGVEAARDALKVPVEAHPLTAERLGARGIRVDGHLEDGRRVELDGNPPMRLRVVHTPGHARGHLCFLDERLGSLIAGDMVAGFGTIVIDPPEGRMEDYLASLEKLRRLAPRTLFPSHGPAIHDAGGKLDHLLSHRLWREDRILEAWRSGVRRSEEIVDRAYDELPEIARPLAERQVEAHLERLREQGRISGR